MPTVLELPRSAVLALWLADRGGPGREPTRAGSAGSSAVLRAVQADDEPHDVLDGDDATASVTAAVTSALADRLADWADPEGDVVCLLPVPGDAAGVPASVAEPALAAGELVLVRAHGRCLALVPQVTAFGTAFEPGNLVTWHVHEVADWRLTVQALGSLEDADRSLRQGLAQVTDALVRLDVAHWDDEHAERVLALRDAALPAWRLPDRVDARRARVLASAARLRAIVEVATHDDGGAVNLWQADQRSAALRDVDRLARHAIAAATLAGPVAGPPQAPRR